MTTNAQQAPAGWYPVDGGHSRYWDGSAWTEHIQAPAKTSLLKSAAGRLTSNEFAVPDGTLWSAVGKGVGGLTTGQYRLDIYYLHLSKGTLRTDAQQVPVADVIDVDVRQSMTQKARGVYTVTVHVQSGASRGAVTMDDIRDGNEAQRVINATARDARLALEHRSIHIDALRHQATNTIRREISYEQVRPAVASAPAQVAAEITVDAIESGPGPEDLFEQITKLAALRDAGILTDDEFSSKKADILSRM
ncbi:SHOCT domain-containing protein [Cellulomonas sp. P5_C6]